MAPLMAPLMARLMACLMARLNLLSRRDVQSIKIATICVVIDQIIITFSPASVPNVSQYLFCVV